MFPPHSLHCALSDSVVSGVFIDTKFYLFSRRKSSGKICRPLPLYVNSAILNSVPYFEDLLSGGFAEGVAKRLDHYPFEDSDNEEDCDYLSDSDLEDLEEDVGVVEPATKAHRVAVENQDPESSVAAIDGSRNELDHRGKVVVLRSVPYLTFRAIVMYLYTGEIDFAPFGSKKNRELRAPELLSKEEGTVPRPSPKSIYRIADMYDMPELKGLAHRAIKDGIKSCDAIEETFSRFTSRHPEMIDLHAKNLASTLLWSDSQDIRERFNEKLQSFANGEIPHAANVVSTLFGVLASDPPPDTRGQKFRTMKRLCTWAEGFSHSVPSCRKSMNIALIKSMHRGSFLDMGYRVRKNRVGANQFAFVYLSSGILHGVRSEFVALVRTTNSTVREGVHEVDDNSDYEDEPIPGPLEATVANNTVREDGIPYHELLPGALKTWRAIFLYLCFDEITFGPLRSQGTPLNAPTTARGTGGVLSCSPKSLYHLAQRLGLDPLADLAFHDIISKLTSENIVRELFSGFTAQKYRLVEKQCLLLTSTLKTPKTTSMFQQCIQGVANGASPHCYDALKLTFGNTVDAIKQERGKQRAQRDAERKLCEEVEQKKREEAKRKAREEVERGVREEVEREVREELERKVREEVERKVCEEVERKVREEVERRAQGGPKRKTNSRNPYGG